MCVSDRRGRRLQAKATLLHRDAARLVQERLPVARAHDERFTADSTSACGSAARCVAAALRARRFFQELVDDDAQVTLAEVAEICRGCSAREASGVHLAQDLRVLRGFQQHTRYTVRLREAPAPSWPPK